MKTKLIAIGLASAMACGNALAVIVMGAVPCGVWVKDRTEKGWNETADRSWLTGFLSGLAIESEKDVLRTVNAESIYLWMDNYCRANPLKQLATGGQVLFEELSKGK
ncbi:MAG: hypothetical protein EON54_03810 [Alcaligenaceae bacterium]|nr:MAG: hypothetical protein EON54_03810 [Alcaligenaceae bacterium]